VIDAAAWLAMVNPEEQARRFANDALWFGQQACSSPRFVFWRGAEALVEQAAADFWPRVEAAATKAGLPWSPRAAMDKLVAEQLHASRGSARIRPTASNRVRVIHADAFGSAIAWAPRKASSSNTDRGTSELLPLVQRLWQTIVSIGVDPADWRAFLTEAGPHGIDRIVPAGAALDFSKVWDGQNLLDAMTRRVDLSTL
jgi:hypothetical protein